MWIAYKNVICLLTGKSQQAGQKRYHCEWNTHMLFEIVWWILFDYSGAWLSKTRDLVCSLGIMFCLSGVRHTLTHGPIDLKHSAKILLWKFHWCCHWHPPCRSLLSVMKSGHSEGTECQGSSVGLMAEVALRLLSFIPLYKRCFCDLVYPRYWSTYKREWVCQSYPFLIPRNVFNDFMMQRSKGKVRDIRDMDSEWSWDNFGQVAHLFPLSASWYGGTIFVEGVIIFLYLYGSHSACCKILHLFWVET